MFQWVWFCTAVKACRTEAVWILVIVPSITKHKERKPQNPTIRVMTTTCEIWPYWTGACGCPDIDISERKTTPEPCSCESLLQLVAFIRHLPAHPVSPVLCSLAAVALQGCWAAIPSPGQGSRATLGRSEGLPKHRYLFPPFLNTEQSNADFWQWHHRNYSPIPTTCQPKHVAQ